MTEVANDRDTRSRVFNFGGGGGGGRLPVTCERCNVCTILAKVLHFEI